jgi:hypothetical protein
MLFGVCWGTDFPLCTIIVNAASIVRLGSVVECRLAANLESRMSHMQLPIDLFSQSVGSRILALIASTGSELSYALASIVNLGFVSVRTSDLFFCFFFPQTFVFKWDLFDERSGLTPGGHFASTEGVTAGYTHTATSVVRRPYDSCRIRQ